MGKISEERWNRVIRKIDDIAKPVVVFSIIIFLIEEERQVRNHLETNYQLNLFFMWCEWIIFAFLTIEFVVR